MVAIVAASSRKGQIHHREVLSRLKAGTERLKMGRGSSSVCALSHGRRRQVVISQFRSFH